ncbi:MAG: outer membrane beta-barrel protein [Ignavibacteriaceae bacterium]
MLIKKILIVIVFITCSGFSQVEDTTYSLTTEIGLGYSRYFTTMDYSDLNKSGFFGTLRIMWNPEHLLSIGLETGYQYLYSIDVKNIQTEFGTSNFSASMVSVPIFIAIAMKLTPNIKLIGGSGTYLLFNNGNLFGDELKSSQISIGAHAGIAYVHPLTDLISIGGELQYSYYSKIQDQCSSVCISL